MYVKYWKVFYNNIRILWRDLTLGPLISKRVVNGYCNILSYYVCTQYYRPHYLMSLYLAVRGEWAYICILRFCPSDRSRPPYIITLLERLLVTTNKAIYKQ